jgi:parvulin-like peptidyl-prolyl isomerase
MCVCLGALAWGQAKPGATAPPSQSSPAQAAPAAEAAKPAAPAPEVPMNAVVLTIKGVCPATATAPAKAAAGATDATGKTATGKTAAKKPADCKTELTRAQFEKIENGVSTNVTPQLKRQLESALPKFMAMSEAAKAKGMENTEYYKENLKIAKMQILTNELTHQVQQEAEKVPEEKIKAYYDQNPEAYEQFSLDRLFIPKHKTVAPEEKKADADDKDEKKDDKLTPEQEEEKQKAKEAEEKAKQEQGDAELAKLADDLQKRAAAGEDFTKLQKEAFEAAGSKVDNPKVNLPKVRRTGLPPAHAAVFDLKVGEVSQVISDNGGHYIYKVVSKELLPLDDQISGEIHNKLKNEQLKAMMDKYNDSYQAIPNEAYFGPPQAAAPPRMRPGMNMPPQPQGAPGQPSAPPSKPN